MPRRQRRIRHVSPFQAVKQPFRLQLSPALSWGVAPGYNEAAPLALGPDRGPAAWQARESRKKVRSENTESRKPKTENLEIQNHPKDSP